MKFGLHGVNLHSCAYPEAAARLGRAAEAAGFDSLWVADHVVLPDPPVPDRPMAPDMRLLDPIVALTFLAAHTSRILLGTGVIILPQRQALVLAKQLASLDVLSNGRVVFGLGVGWCEPEMRSVVGTSRPKPYQPWPCVTARRKAGAVRPPTTIFGVGVCTGRGMACTPSNETKRPLNAGLGCVHIARIAARYSSAIRPRSAKDAPTERISGSHQPTPRPNTTRPFDRTSREASCLARTSAWRCGRMITPVPSRMRVV